MKTAFDALCRADSLCLDRAELLLDGLSRFPSSRGRESFRKALEDARTLLANSHPQNAFGRLFGRHLLHGWRLLEELVELRWHWPGASPAPLLAALAGEDTLSRLEAAVAAIDSEAIWDYLQRLGSYRVDRLPVTAAMEQIEQVAARTKSELTAWLDASGYDLPGLDAELVVAPDPGQHCYYQHRAHRIVLAAGVFMVFSRGGGVRVNPAGALTSLAHELLGHAVQDTLCDDLPEPLHPGRRSALRLSSQVAAEGLAEHTFSLVRRFAAERGKQLGLDTGDVELIDSEARLGSAFHALPALAHYARMQSAYDPGFDPHGYLAEVAGHDGFGELLSACQPQPRLLLYEASTWFGTEMVRETEETLVEQGITRAESWRRLARGAWSTDTYREAVAYNVCQELER